MSVCRNTLSQFYGRAPGAVISLGGTGSMAFSPTSAGSVPMSPTFTLRAGHLTLADLRGLEAGGVAVALDPAAHQAIDASVETVRAVIRENRTVYGVNTGFGSLARTRIADAELAELQRRLVLSHAAGTGPALPDRVVRLVLLLKAN